jgi:5'-nucleotidase
VLRVLITNDDGITSPGLSVLAEVARSRGHDAFVVAPNWDSSGSSAAVTGVTVGLELVPERQAWPGWPAGAVLAVNATPALIVRLAFQSAFGPAPDVVLSGVNRGANTGRAILHSGTVGAAFTAYHEGRPALATSLGFNDVADGQGAHWATAATVAGRLFDWLVSEQRHVALNCNVPNVPLEQLRGIRVGRLAAVGVSQTSLSERSGASLPLTVGAGEHDVDAMADGLSTPGATAGVATDAALIKAGIASVTAVVPVVEDSSVDLAAALGPGLLGPGVPAL